MRNILIALFLLASIGANGQTLLGERQIDTNTSFMFSADSTMATQIEDYISVDDYGTVHVHGDTMQAIRRLYKIQIEAWGEVKEWQERYFDLMDRIKTLK